MGFFDFIGDISGGITDQVQTIGQQTGIGPIFTTVGNGLLDVFQSGVSGFSNVSAGIGKIVNGLGDALGGETLNLILICALGGVAVYGVSVLTKNNNSY